MIKAGDLAIQPVRLADGRTQHRHVNLRSPNLRIFTPEQIAIVDGVIEELRGSTAEEVSLLSHRMVGWKAVESGETIPYETIFVSDEPLTEAEIERAQELSRKLPQYGRQ